MRKRIHRNLDFGLATLAAAILIGPVAGCAQDESDAVADARSAAWPGKADGATGGDWEGKLWREGTKLALIHIGR